MEVYQPGLKAKAPSTHESLPKSSATSRNNTRETTSCVFLAPILLLMEMERTFNFPHRPMLATHVIFLMIDCLWM
jgi:hypothetical protein